jgi:carboxylate-amine ligase
MIAFGLHVHVGMQNERSAMYVMHEMGRWSYPLLALSANSPFYDGHETGLLSTRTHLFGSMPRASTPPEFNGMEELDDLFQKLIATDDVTAPGELWWLIRPQPPLGTVELRSLDLPTDVRRVGAISAIVQAAMALYQDKFNQGCARSNFSPAYLDQNRWKAMRYGLEGKIIEPETGEILTMREQLERLLDMIGPKAQELGSTTHIEFAAEMLQTETEAEWQIRTGRELRGDLKALELEIAKRTLP